MADARLAVFANLKRLAFSQFGNFDFNSMCLFNGIPLGANSDGIYTLFDADDDDGTNIESYFELSTTDFGISKTKKIRFLYVHCETAGTLKVKLQVDEDEERTFVIIPKKTGNLQHRTHRVDGRTDLRGVYWRPRIENTKGCDFSIDNIEALLMILG